MSDNKKPSGVQQGVRFGLYLFILILLVAASYAQKSLISEMDPEEARNHVFSLVLFAFGVPIGILLWFKGLPVLIDKLSRPKKCAMCGVDTFEFYLDTKDKSTNLCRRHIFERWKMDVLNSVFDMIVIEPRKSGGVDGYVYGTVSDLKLWHYTNPDIERVKDIFNLIKQNKCAKCEKNATVAYYRKDQFEWPFFGKLPTDAEFLCKSCLFLEIGPSIENLKGKMEEGFRAPGPGEGVYHVQEF